MLSFSKHTRPNDSNVDVCMCRFIPSGLRGVRRRGAVSKRQNTKKKVINKKKRLYRICPLCERRKQQGRSVVRNSSNIREDGDFSNE